MGYVAVFLPIFLHRTQYKRYAFLAVAILLFVLTAFLLLTVRFYQAFLLLPAFVITAYSFIPLLICALICLLPWNGLMKGGVCTLVCAVMYYFVGYVVDFLLHTKRDHYYVDFHNWEQCINGNVQLLIFLSAALIGVVLLLVGLRMGKKA